MDRGTRSSSSQSPVRRRKHRSEYRLEWRQVSWGKICDAIMRKHYDSLILRLVIEASTAFRLLTPPQSVPIVAALNLCGRILARVLDNARREIVCRNRLRFVTTNGEKHA